MKNLLFLFLLLVLPFVGSSQDCDLDFTVEDVICDGTTINFTLSITDMGVPVNVNNSGSFSFAEEGSTTQLFFVEGPGNGSEVPFVNQRMGGQLLNNTTCEQVFNTTLEILFTPSELYNCSSDQSQSGDGALVFFPPPAVNTIPTLGQWGLIVLSLMLIIFAVKSITSSKLASTEK